MYIAASINVRVGQKGARTPPKGFAIDLYKKLMAVSIDEGPFFWMPL